ncbi:hypothetical protein ACPTJF_21315 [Enterococcus faecalis]
MKLVTIWLEKQNEE